MRLDHAHALCARFASAFAKDSTDRPLSIHPYGAGPRLHGLAMQIHELSGLADALLILLTALRRVPYDDFADSMTAGQTRLSGVTVESLNPPWVGSIRSGSRSA